MLSSGHDARRNGLRVAIILSVLLASWAGCSGLSCAEEYLIFDGFVFDTDGVTPVEAMVIAYYPAYPQGIATETYMDGTWQPYGYYMINGARSGGTATIYAYTYNMNADHAYMDRKSQEVVVDLDGYANGSHVTRNLTLQALPHEPDPVVTFKGRITRSGREAAFAHVYVSYGSYLYDRTAGSLGFYDFQLAYVDRPAEMWVTCDGYESPHWTTTTTPGGTVNFDWDVPLPAPTSTPPPYQTPTPRPCPTPTVKPYIVYTGIVYCGGVPVKDAGVFCTYGEDTTGVATNATGGYQITMPNRGGLATIKASYFGTSAEDYRIFPEFGSVVRHDFYVTTTHPATATPAPPAGTATPSATIAAGSGTASVTPWPTQKVSATPAAAQGINGPPLVRWNIDFWGLLKAAALVAGALIAVLLVLYCLAILVVTKL